MQLVLKILTKVDFSDLLGILLGFVGYGFSYTYFATLEIHLSETLFEMLRFIASMLGALTAGAMGAIGSKLIEEHWSRIKAYVIRFFRFNKKLPKQDGTHNREH